jgi:hypothetical protein
MLFLSLLEGQVAMFSHFSDEESIPFVDMHFGLRYIISVITLG